MYKLPGGGVFESGNQEYVLRCKCGSKFTWNIQMRTGHCWGCKLVISNLSILYKNFGPGTHDPPAQQPITRTSRQSNLVSVEEAPEILEYLASRRVSKSLALNVGIQADPVTSTVYVPVTSQLLNEPPFWMYRSIREGSFGWMAPPQTPKSAYWFGYPQYHQCREVHEGLQNKPHPPILVEGIFDVLSPGLWGWGVALLGSKLSPLLEAFLGAVHTEVWLWMDNDGPGRIAQKTIAGQLSAIGVRVVEIQYPDDRKDPGSYTLDETTAILRPYHCNLNPLF